MSAAELEYHLITAMLLAGKSATFVEGVNGRLYGKRTVTAFEWFRKARKKGGIEAALRKARSGNYTKLANGIDQVIDAGLDLEKCGPAELQQIHGIGPKTARFFIIWTRPGADFAALDTHVLKWLRFIGHGAPASTPGGAEYLKWQAVFLSEAKARKMSARELDSAIWDWCSAGKHRGGVWPANLQRRK